MRYTVVNISNGRINLPAPVTRSLGRSEGFVFDSPQSLLERPYGKNNRANSWQALIDSNLISITVDSTPGESTALQYSVPTSAGTGPQAGSILIPNLTTTGLGDGDFGYISANNVVSKTDAASAATSNVIGANTGIVGSMSASGVIEHAKFTTAGGSPTAGSFVYLAVATDDGNTAAGKLTAVAPVAPGTQAVEVGIVLSNVSYASAKTCRVLLQRPIITSN